MLDQIVSNPLDNETCDYCSEMTGEVIALLDDFPPFDFCTSPNGCRCKGVNPQEVSDE